MTPPDRPTENLWGSGPTLIGMIHLLPLPGSPRWDGSMETVLKRAVLDARALTEAGLDGVIVENFGDTPFHPERVSAETVSALTAAVIAVRAETGLPVGVNVLRNDADAALSVAAVTGARFIRVNVHTGSMWTDQGLIHGQAASTLRKKAVLSATVEVWADVHVKHAVPPVGSDLASAARDAWTRGHADGLIVSGTGTGLQTTPADVATVRAALADARIVIGSGLTAENAHACLEHADGAIIGSALMRDGQPGGAVDSERAKALVRIIRDQG